MNRRIPIFIVLVILGFIEVGLFMTSTTYTQLGIATLFYPVLVISIFRLFPGKAKKKLPLRTPFTPAYTATPVNTPVGEAEEVSDINKRAFLNLVFSAGIAFFIYSIFNKRSELSFFGKAADSGAVVLQDPSGNKIIPAQDQPTDGYQISDIDDLGIDFIYYGYTRTDGYWYIAKHDATSGTFRYVKGQTNFPTSWSNRSHLKYDYFYIVFS